MEGRSTKPNEIGSIQNPTGSKPIKEKKIHAEGNILFEKIQIKK